MMDLIYISNTRIPSEKANTYQSFCVCESLATLLVSVEFWHPQRAGDYMDQVRGSGGNLEEVFDNFGVTRVFTLRRLFCLDLPWINRFSNRFWFMVEASTFALSCLNAMRREQASKVVLTRDGITMSILAICKRLGLIKQSLFYEAHSYSPRRAFLSRFIDGLIVINSHLKEKFDPEDKMNILVAHDGIRSRELEPPVGDGHHRGNTILYAGNLFEWKGVYTLADCADHLPLNSKIVFLGGSPETLSAFEKYVAGKSNVEIIGHKPRKEVRCHLKSADMLVLPNSAKFAMSDYTSPLKLFEYMAARRPIIASRIPSLQEVLRDGENAILFNPDDPQDLADKIRWVLENDCSDIVDRAWLDVQGYTWDKRAEKMVGWMNDLIRGKGGVA